ncbi:acetolactate decarboxylase, partial [Staphylococcus epidermidis]|uniref:acetolactate decarboxylase n=1 Tax=Staphylococcus epidermidis TaxID=1282 RepID=UPI0016429CDB
MTNLFYQHPTLPTLIARLLQPTPSINHLLQHPHLRIPTLTPSDPQLIFLHRKPYHPNQHKHFIQFTRHQITPYPTLTKFKPHSTFKTSNKNQQQLFHQLKKQITTQNIFSPLKISPTFKKIHLPIIPPQQPPYTPLIHAPPTQPQ